VHRVKQQKM